MYNNNKHKYNKNKHKLMKKNNKKKNYLKIKKKTFQKVFINPKFLEKKSQKKVHKIAYFPVF